MSGSEKLRNYIDERAGHNCDVKIPPHIFEKCREELSETNRTVVETKSFRDSENYRSLHISDFRPKSSEDLIVGHIEKFNPENNFLIPLHILVDFPLWILKNKVLGKRQV